MLAGRYKATLASNAKRRAHLTVTAVSIDPLHILTPSRLPGFHVPRSIRRLVSPVFGGAESLRLEGQDCQYCAQLKGGMQLDGRAYHCDAGGSIEV